MNYLYIANIFVWAGIGLYLCFIHVEQRRLTKRIEHLEGMHGR